MANFKKISSFNDVKSLEKQIYKKTKEYFSNALEFSSFRTDKTINDNKTLESVSAMPASIKNTENSIISHKHKKIMVNNYLKNKIKKNIKKKMILKMFDKNFRDFSPPNNKTKVFKYDFRKSYNTNRKMFKYSIFDFYSPKKSPETLHYIDNRYIITNTLNANCK